MGSYLHTDFSAGWNPSADPFSAPKNCYLRGDNLTLDELGVLSLRQGSAKINEDALTQVMVAFDHNHDWEETYLAAYFAYIDPVFPTEVEGVAQFTQEWERAYLNGGMFQGPGDHNHGWEVTDGYVTTEQTVSEDTDAHSLFTTTISGTKYRMVGASDAVYSNDEAIWNSVDGSGDTSFGTHMGQILFARGDTKKKYDGTTVRNWGIAAPIAAPTLSALTADSKVLASCASAESPAMTQNEGTQTFANDRAGTGNAAVQIAPDTTTGRGMSTKTFATAQDYSTYTGGGTATDEDLIDFYAKVAEPQYITSLTLLIDVNDGTFQQDYYWYTFQPGEAVEVVNDASESLNSNYAVESFERQRIEAIIEEQSPPESVQFLESAGSWNHFNIARGKMERVGLTSGKNWSTVFAVRVIVNAIAGGSGAAVTFDEIQLIGGSTRQLTGKYKAAIVAVRNDGVYQSLSAPSAFSTEFEVKAQGIRATLDAATVDLLDPQVTELWLYLMGGKLDAFYRFATKTGGPFNGAQTIDATISEITALAANLRMETDNTVPPDDVIGIEGPHFDRTLVLTEQFVYASRQLNPDSYSQEIVRIGDTVEVGKWIMRLGEATVFVGTTRDVYRLDGDWTPQPDGSINVVKRPMHVSEPPISSAVAKGSINGVETIIYLTGHGWHALGGGSLVDSSVDLLWRGFTRHGVSPVNITSLSSRFRSAVSKNVLFCLTPEGSDTTSSTTIHAYHFSKQRWYRFTYPQAFRSLYTEYDGTLVAGDESGFVRTLDLSTKQDDGVDIPVVLWTPADDNGQPFTYKDPENMWLRLATAENEATVSFHLNGSDGADSATTTTQATTDTLNANVSTTAEFQQLQLRITGSFSTFIMRGWGLRYLDNPLPQVIHDTGYLDLTKDVLKWITKIRVKAKSPVNLTVQPYWDGEAAETRTITVGAQAGVATVFDVPLGREDRARTARVVITSASPSHVFWLEFYGNGTGKPLQKWIATISEAA